MRNLLHCRRGSAAFAIVIALVPLIGVVALGGEAGSWYVTKQHAQSTPRMAPLIRPLSGLLPPMVRLMFTGKEFAAQNNFCNAGDSSYPESSQLRRLFAVRRFAVRNDRSRNLGSGDHLDQLGDGSYARATIQQTQPAYTGGGAWRYRQHRRPSRCFS